MDIKKTVAGAVVATPATNTSNDAVLADQVLKVSQSLHLTGEVELVGAKNAVLVIMASLVLAKGISILENVPNSADVLQMITLLEDLGAIIVFDPIAHRLEVDTRSIDRFYVKHENMKKMRASILVMGPLLARFGQVQIASPGGCVIGPRPIDFHIKNFESMGVQVTTEGDSIIAYAQPALKAGRIVLEYPSVGATENALMAATLTEGTTTIINAAVEPEVLDLVDVLKKMGASIDVLAPATIRVQGVSSLQAISHSVVPDRLEAGTLLLAAAITGGSIHIPQARADHLDVFLAKLEEMGHRIVRGQDDRGISLYATKEPKAVSFRTSPYPGFPTDLQAPMMAAQCLARGKSVIYETVFENRLLHVRELQKMGAQITVDGDRATVTGVDQLYGASVIASDIRASCALVLAGLAAHGVTNVTGIMHWRRGYEGLEQKLHSLGAHIELQTTNKVG